MELGSPAPRFITAATENYSEPDESSLHPSTQYYLDIYCNIFLPPLKPG